MILDWDTQSFSNVSTSYQCLWYGVVVVLGELLALDCYHLDQSDLVLEMGKKDCLPLETIDIRKSYKFAIQCRSGLVLLRQDAFQAYVAA